MPPPARSPHPSDLHSLNEVCRVKGRAGVGLLTDLEVTDKRYGLPSLGEDVDSGRWIETDVKTPQGYTIAVACVYVHAGNTDDSTKMEQKYRFLDTMLTRMGELRDEPRTAASRRYCAAISTSRTRRSTSRTPRPTKARRLPARGRAYVDKWLDEYEFVDVMRSLAGDIQGPYTWWSQRGRAFDNNVGWRIDYQFATPELAETARGFVIDKAPTYELRWSDHAPLTITYDV